MPRKIRELIADLERAGFRIESGKGSHRKFVHPVTRTHVSVSGQLGDDVRRYQERMVIDAIKESKR
jgi:predicted RNA binding protein YcfA (HicA-like mRNA interferase family)